MQAAAMMSTLRVQKKSFCAQSVDALSESPDDERHQLLLSSFLDVTKFHFRCGRVWNSILTFSNGPPGGKLKSFAKTGFDEGPRPHLVVRSSRTMLLVSRKRPQKSHVSDSPPKRSKLEPILMDSFAGTAQSCDDENLNERRGAFPTHDESSPDSRPSTSEYSSSSSSAAETSEKEDDSDASHSSSDSDDEADEPITITTRPKPRIHRVPDSDLSSRLSAFLPALKAANEDLQRDLAAGRLVSAELHEDSEEATEELEGDGQRRGQYIEMVCAVFGSS